MRFTINGSEHTFDRVSTIAELLHELLGGPTPPGVAVAVNDVVVPRQRWGDTSLIEGDRVEVITAVQGG